GRRLSKVHRATEWLRPSFARSSATMSASVRDQMPKPSCVSCQLGSPTTTRFTRTRLSDIVHPVSSSQLTQDPNRVRSFGGYDTLSREVFSTFGRRNYLERERSGNPLIAPRDGNSRPSALPPVPAVLNSLKDNIRAALIASLVARQQPPKK